MAELSTDEYIEKWDEMCDTGSLSPELHEKDL